MKQNIVTMQLQSHPLSSHKKYARPSGETQDVLNYRLTSDSSIR